MQKYRYREYSPDYPALFSLEKEKIAQSLGYAVSIEHVGSTAIPGLGGKGLIDIAIGIVGIDLEQAKEDLIKAGYEYREQASCPERLFFRIDHPYNSETRRVHIHLTKLNGRDWKEMIGFRDYLLHHPEAVEQYAKIKKDGVSIAKGDGRLYRKHKEEFINKISNNLSSQ